MSSIRGFLRRGTLRTGLVMALCALAVAGCSVMSSSPGFEIGKGFHGCTSALGSYVLPRSVLHIQIQHTVSSGDFVLSQLAAERVPDNAHNYCLEHDSNPFAEDSVRVYKTKIDKRSGDTAYKVYAEEGTPFLQLIASKAVDHSAGIIRNFIRAAFIGISNNPAFPGRAAFQADASSPVVADHQVDPFNYFEMAELNQAIRRYGFCVVLSGYTFDESKQSASAYCDAPKGEAKRHAPPSHKAIASMRWRVAKPSAGIFYRPRAPYKVEIYIKHRPDDRGEWQLAMIKTVQMENIMPVVSVGVERALFATRRTGLIFDDGELADVCISRGNSIAGATNIVLDVVYGIINLPAATIQGVINDTNTRKSLLEKRKQLIQAQEDYIKFLQGGPKVASAESKNFVALNLSESNRPPRPVGSPADAQKIADSPADAGTILNGGTSNPLNDICAKLQAAAAPTDLTTAGPTGGTF